MMSGQTLGYSKPILAFYKLYPLGPINPKCTVKGVNTCSARSTEDQLSQEGKHYGAEQGGLEGMRGEVEKGAGKKGEAGQAMSGTVPSSKQ